MWNKSRGMIFFWRHCIWPCILGYCLAERWICLPVSDGKQTEPGFLLGLCLCLALSIFFILKNSLILVDDKHTHNTMQPPLSLKIWRVVLSDVLRWICPKRIALYSWYIVNFFARFFCSFILVPYFLGIFLFSTDCVIFTL